MTDTAESALDIQLYECPTCESEWLVEVDASGHPIDDNPGPDCPVCGEWGEPVA